MRSDWGVAPLSAPYHKEMPRLSSSAQAARLEEKAASTPTILSAGAGVEAALCSAEVAAPGTEVAAPGTSGQQVPMGGPRGGR
jgi:hypothetical protein